MFGLAIHVLWQLKSSIDVRRNRLSCIKEKYSDTYRECRGEKKQVSAGEMFFFLLLVLLIGFSNVRLSFCGGSFCHTEGFKK